MGVLPGHMQGITHVSPKVYTLHLLSAPSFIPSPSSANQPIRVMVFILFRTEKTSVSNCGIFGARWSPKRRSTNLETLDGTTVTEASETLPEVVITLSLPFPSLSYSIHLLSLTFSSDLLAFIILFIFSLKDVKHIQTTNRYRHTEGIGCCRLSFDLTFLLLALRARSVSSSFIFFVFSLSSFLFFLYLFLFSFHLLVFL